ncbi:lasso peptide biosynthesis B2 protein [Paenibacillus sedimenti]|uniref:Lasso peptide biosynthesis B2 protein n=1 Tax=Paenibacillus sedimenti TaxID=2770274 RepID=A0A926QIQ5_9BACL|nr:lasso peptide biosynthesis B2 protein [Paenibacillus sedimenti]MBD0379749.1 lasso peptide biosynthesis B2 protein [Paenibacillus sedimenti]
MWKKVRTLLRLHPRMILLLFEALFYLAWARILKSVPFAKVAPSLGNRREETPHTGNQPNETLIKDISKAVRMMSRNTIWESKCLVQAIAGMKMLERRKIESTLYLGTARDTNGKMIAHAWLRSGSIYISGAETMDKFTVVEVFGKRIQRLES